MLIPCMSSAHGLSDVWYYCDYEYSPCPELSPPISCAKLWASSLGSVRIYDLTSSVTESSPLSCFACAFPFPPRPSDINEASVARTTMDVTLAPSSRYMCPKCHQHFCLECDAFVQEHLHTCPGCTWLDLFRACCTIIAFLPLGRCTAQLKWRLVSTNYSFNARKDCDIFS